MQRSTKGLLLPIGILAIALQSCGTESGQLPAMNTEVDLASESDGLRTITLDAPTPHLAPAGSLLFRLSSADPLPDEFIVGTVSFAALPTRQEDGSRTYAATIDAAFTHLDSIIKLELPVTQATVEVSSSVAGAEDKLNHLDKPDPTALIYFGNPEQVTFEEFVIVRATADLPPNLRTPSHVATRANELYPAGSFQDVQLNPIPDNVSTDFADGGTAPPPDSVDALVVYASTFLPPDSRTPETIVATASVLAPGINLSVEDIAAIPGQVLPGGIVLSVTARVAGSFQLSVQQVPFPLPTVTIDSAHFVNIGSMFPGFTSFVADPDSSSISLTFNQVVIPDLDPGICVIAHTSGTDPEIAENHIARSAACPAHAAIFPVAQTPNLIDGDDTTLGRFGDGGDPAIYVHPTSPSLSVVITTLQEGGLAVYDLDGSELQFIDPDYGAPESARFNNVDLRYNFPLGDTLVDIVVATERNNNTIRIYKIDPEARQMVDITAESIGPNLFPDFKVGNDNGEAYGVSIYRSVISSKFYVFVNSNDRCDIAQLELVDNGDGSIAATRIERPIILPTQCEGMVADDELGLLYVGEEDVGLWKFSAEPDGGTTGTLIEQVKPNGSVLAADLKGLTLYYGSGGQGYLLASSQGDSTFAVFTREGDNDYLGSFSVGRAGSIDSVEASDGASVINLPMGPNFAQGLFVAHDGFNEPEVLVLDDGELENINTNFKLVPWEQIANSFDPPLVIDTSSYNPRDPS